MAHMTQAKKATIKAELDKVVPKSWKYSLAVRNHSTIVMTIKSAPVDLLSEYKNGKKISHDGYLQLNEFYLKDAYTGDTLDLLQKFVDALNLNNFDKSDIMSDYHHVGHYVNLHVGEWDKPFIVKV